MPKILQSVFTTFILLLSGCSPFLHSANYSASGYHTDQGTIRLWRHQKADKHLRIRTFYTPTNQRYSQITDFYWQDNKLLAVEQQSSPRSNGKITLRFSRDDEVNFMQRQLAEHREPLSEREITYYRYIARKVRQLSDALNEGKIRLHQGRLQPDNSVMDCQSDNKLDFRLAESSPNSGITLPFDNTSRYIAWLSGPQGQQPLMVSHQNLCQQQKLLANF